MILYRYRSIDSALKEIEFGTFHFATRTELNDPVEGYIRVYWKGDKAAWEGLLRNYICSLKQAITAYRVCGDETLIHNNTLIIDLHRFDNTPAERIINMLGDRFLKNNEIQKIATYYGAQDVIVNEKELHFILFHAHRIAFTICIQADYDEGKISDKEFEILLKPFLGEKDFSFPFDLFEDISLKPDRRLEIINTIENTLEDLLEYHYLQFGFKNEDAFLYGIRSDESGNAINTSKTEKAHQFRNWLSIVIDYPKIYINQIKAMLFPENYVVCFSGKNNNSSMWGNYADCHRGICFVYETRENNKINLGEREEISLEIRHVTYGGDIIERNFFESLGKLNLNQIKTWLTGTEGLSSCYNVYLDGRLFREEYWKNFEDKTFRKLKSWEHEDEYRISIDNTFFSLEKPEERNIKYSNKDLKGVIFGINTSEYDKMQIMEKLIKKANEYSDLKFYQAEYDDEKQIINIREKTVWKLE